MSKLHKVSSVDTLAWLLILRVEYLRRENLPVVVCIIERVARNLLALAGDTSVIVTKRVFVCMTVEIGFGLFVPDGNGIVVVNGGRLCTHHVVAQSLLEGRSHEVVSGSRLGKNSKMNLEPEKIDEERDHNQTSCTGCKMLAKFC